MNHNLNQIDNLILDMDGVLWHGETPVPGLASFFMMIRRRQIGYILATNNATKTPDQYANKLDRFGVDVPVDRILTSAEATAGYLRKTYPAGSSAYIVGEMGLHKAMESQGYRILDEEIDDLSSIRADLVVVGMTQNVCYRHLAIANHLIGNGATFIGTNPDVTYPSELGRMPGAGSILAFLETASGIAPKVIGKPNSIMFLEAIHRLSGSVDNTVMVGDRMNTDIVGAHSVGLRTVLLMSGIATRADLKTAMIEPDWVFDDLISFAAAFETTVPVPGDD
ncbi:MAG: HAD-IIA family hydrolase [Candidatus Promineifilaceae bacterium]